MAKYEFWLTDDYGKRIYLFKDIAFASYSRSTIGLGTIQLGCPFDKFQKAIPSVFQVDWRIDVWRSADEKTPARREGSFLLRKFIVYERETDHVRIIEFFGRSPIDILRRQSWRGAVSLTDTIDNLMKTLVSGRFVTNLTAYSTSPNIYTGSAYVSTGELTVDGYGSDGPSYTDSFYLKNILDALNNLRDASITLNRISSSNKKIYFDLVEDDTLVSGGFGYKFMTFPALRGIDRTGGVQYSTENGNLGNPSYYEDYTDEITSIFLFNNQQTWASQNAQSNDQYLSRWNYIEDAQSTSIEASAAALNSIYAQLKQVGVQKVMRGDFLNSPGSKGQPRSLYGIDWDLGDLLPCKFAGKVMNLEVAIVYVSIDENGKEKITGKTTVGE